jgi:hypothetical protein
MKISVFWTFSDIEMILGMIVYNNELRSGLSFVVIGQYLSELWAFGLSHISEVKFAARVF